MSRHMHDLWPDVNPAVRGLRIAGMVVLGVIGAAIFALVFGWLVMILWNWLYAGDLPSRGDLLLGSFRHHHPRQADFWRRRRQRGMAA